MKGKVNCQSATKIEHKRKGDHNQLSVTAQLEREVIQREHRQNALYPLVMAAFALKHFHSSLHPKCTVSHDM